MLRLAFDIGGTFTDYVLQDQRTGRVRIWKVPTTREPAVGATAVLVTVSSESFDQSMAWAARPKHFPDWRPAASRPREPVYRAKSRHFAMHGRADRRRALAVTARLAVRLAAAAPGRRSESGYSVMATIRAAERT